VVTDDENSTINRVAFVENRIKMIKSNNMNKIIKKDFIKIVLYLAQLLKSPILNEKNKIKYHKYAKYIYFFELKLFKIQKSIKTSKSKSEFQSFDFEGLRRLFNCSNRIHNTISIEKYLNGIFRNFKNFNEKTQKYFVQSPSYFSQLCNLLSETNNLILANYIGYYALNDLISIMPFKYRKIKDQLVKSENFITTEQVKKIDEIDKKTVLRICAKKADNAFEFVTGSLFLLHRNSTIMTTDVIRNMTRNLKETFVSSIPDLEWMDRKTKKNAIFKAEHMNINIGYPTWILNETLLNREYKTVEITDLLFLNELSIRRYNRNKILKKVLFTSSRSEWNMQPLEVNAYYTQLKNSIGFPIGLLSDPFFNNFALPALNYGSIGNN
jgi:predicted metalloendopeptidase